MTNMQFAGADRRRGVPHTELRDPVLRSRADAFVAEHGGVLAWRDAPAGRGVLVAWMPTATKSITLIAPTSEAALSLLISVCSTNLNQPE